MIEFEVSGQAYKARRMDAMTEEAVSRKLAPLLNLAVPALSALKNGQGKIDLAAFEGGKMIETLTRTIATLPDEAARFIIASCLSACQRQQGAAWAPVWSKNASAPMFDDIRAPQMYLICAKVLEEAFRDFMRALGPSFSAEGGPLSDTIPSDSQPA